MTNLPTPLPEPPTWLDDLAREFWSDHAPRLHAAGTLTQANLPAFAVLCRFWSRWRAADTEATKLGAVVRTQAGGAARNPYAIEAESCWTRVERLMIQFGLMPEARKRSQRDKPAAAFTEQVELDFLL